MLIKTLENLWWAHENHDRACVSHFRRPQLSLLGLNYTCDRGCDTRWVVHRFHHHRQCLQRRGFCNTVITLKCSRILKERASLWLWQHESLDLVPPSEDNNNNNWEALRVYGRANRFTLCCFEGQCRAGCASELKLKDGSIPTSNLNWKSEAQSTDTVWTLSFIWS